MAWFSRAIIIVLLCYVPFGAKAQQPATPPTQSLLKPAELDQLLAPIALHPDPLLSEILIASTYPLEVVQADRWAKSNTALKGDALITAVGKQSWDDSVKSLVQVPSVLAMMSEQLDWTQKLGDAVLAQQADVMDAIQRLRARARANGKLESTKEQTVTVKMEDQKQYVVIEPTSTNQISFRTMSPPLCTGIGLIRTMRRTISRRRTATFPAPRLPQGLHSPLALPLAMPSGATATGAATTSTWPAGT